MRKPLSSKAKRAIIVTTAIISVMVLSFLGFVFYVIGFNNNPDSFYDVSQKEESDKITLMNFNLRYVTIRDIGNKSWFVRAPHVVNHIAETGPDIICFQEATPIHIGYFDNALKGYDYEYKTRSAGYSEGTPVYYNASKFEKVSSGSFWLSETPEKHSKDWGSSNYRICVYVVLKQISDGKKFVVFNTHLDNESESARINGIQVVLDKINELGNLPTILAGDMNDTCESETYAFARKQFDDARLIASDTVESTITFNAYGDENLAEEIDFCFMSKGEFDVSLFRVLNEKKEIMPSDHYALKVEFTLK